MKLSVFALDVDVHDSNSDERAEGRGEEAEGRERVQSPAEGKARVARLSKVQARERLRALTANERWHSTVDAREVDPPGQRPVAKALSLRKLLRQIKRSKLTVDCDLFDVSVSCPRSHQRGHNPQSACCALSASRVSSARVLSRQAADLVARLPSREPW